jgi:AcrR family transcriptional regulator
MTAPRPARQVADDQSTRVRRMGRAERREQILDAATRAFARSGFAATGLDNVAAEAGVSHVILYRHFASKTELYRAALDSARARLADTVGTDDYDEETVPMLLRAAAADPEGFRLLFRHAAREPEFRDVIDTIRSTSIEFAHRHLATRIPAGPWRDWAARLVPTVTLEAIIAWLDAGQPEPDRAAEHIWHAVEGVIHAALGDRSGATGGSENVGLRRVEH